MLDARMDKTCKITIIDKILIVLEIFSILSNFRFKIKLSRSTLNVSTLIGIANLNVTSALKAWRLFISSKESLSGDINSFNVLSDGDFHLERKLLLLSWFIFNKYSSKNKIDNFLSVDWNCCEPFLKKIFVAESVFIIFPFFAISVVGFVTSLVSWIKILCKPS